MHRPYICNMECAVHVWDVKKFPAGLNISESEEASRKRGLEMEFHPSTLPCDKSKCSVHG